MKPMEYHAELRRRADKLTKESRALKEQAANMYYMAATLRGSFNATEELPEAIANKVRFLLAK